MFRTLLLTAAFGISTLGLSAADPAKGAGAGKFDAAKVFAKMDANGDGKVTREEFQKYAESMKDKAKKAAANADAAKPAAAKPAATTKGKGKGGVFDKIDTNHDGVITLEEFEKFHANQSAKAKTK